MAINIDKSRINHFSFYCVFPLPFNYSISFGCYGVFKIVLHFRKPRINPQLVAQQVAQQYTQSQPKQKSSSSKPDKDKKSSSDKTTKKIRPRLKNIDRSSAQQKAVTVNDVTVIITEFQPKRRMSSDNAANGPHSSSGNSTDSSQSDSASHSEAQNGDLSDRR
ncbi:UNVERIFIED_CONTAM: Yaf2 [Trichonephila clavipes]